MASPRICTVEGCGNNAVRREWCSKHYQRWQRHGDPAKTHRYDGVLCLINGCSKPAKAHGLCSTHDMRKRRHGDPSAHPAIRRLGCLVDGCERQHKAQGYCRLHYDRLLKHGDVLEDQPARIPPGERLDWLMRHVGHVGPDCLIWPYSRDHNGYGRMALNGVQVGAARVMTILAHGDPPTPDHQSAHNCGKGHFGCIHPEHLRWDTCAGNHADKVIHGTAMRGTDCHASKLEADDVRQIRALVGKMSQRSIGEIFGIAQTTVGKIARRSAWAWLD